jgi:hypothetical protein
VLLRRRTGGYRRGRTAGALLCASLSLAAALALAAPLVHAHLGGAGTRGLCGEPHPENSTAPTGDACSLCLAGAHAPAMSEPYAPLLVLTAMPNRLAHARPDSDRGVPRRRPGTPRAPPLPA